jgi:hypothetical protein
MAAAPLVSATTLASGLGMAVKNTTALLAAFAKEEIAVEVTHRSKRRLFGLAGLAPLREQVRPPRRPEPGRGRGRPPILRPGVEPPPVLPDRAPTRLERRAFDYSDLEAWMARADQVIRSTRHTLDRLACSEPSGASASLAGATNRDLGEAEDETGPLAPTTQAN